MGRILLVSDGPRGVRFSVLELARRLRVAGHETHFAGPAADRALAEHHELQFHALPPSQLEAFRRKDRQQGRLSRWKKRAQRLAQARAASKVDTFKPLLSLIDPDLVLLDAEMQEHIIITAAGDWPLVLLNSFASVWRQAGSPPPHTQVRPGHGWSGKAAMIDLRWRRYLLEKRAQAFRRRLRDAGCDRISLLKTLADDLGFDLDGEADDGQWLKPFTFPSRPALSLHAQAFELSQSPIDRVTFVGPMCLAERLDPPMPRDEQSTLDDILTRHQASMPKTKLLYAGFGSYFTANHRWLQALFRAIEKRPGWELLLSLGGVSDRASLGALPDRVHAFSWLPQLQLLEQAELAIVHGGIATIDECVLAGLPMLVCPGRATDMPGNTARVLHHGLGLAADPQRDGPADILIALDRLFDDRGFSERVAAMGKRYRRYVTDRVAETAVENLLRSATGRGG